MKNIAKSLAIIAGVAAIVTVGTVAYFSDKETSIGNTFTAGTIDIDIDGENPWTSNYDIGDLKPGEVGYINFQINNIGENPVDVSKKLYNMVEAGGVKTEPECEAEGGTWVNYGDHCTGETPLDNIQTQILYDLSVEVYDSGNQRIWWQAIYEGEDNETLAAIYGDNGGNYVDLGVIPVDGHMMVTQSYHFDYNAGNKYQGDKLTFDMEIYGEQLTGEDGYASVALENKSGAPDWDIILGDNIEGTLKYKTKGSIFDYNFTGKVRTTRDYILLYVGPTNDWPCTNSVILGTGNFTAGTELTISGQVNTGTITNGKIWLIPSTSYSGGEMTGWPEANILFETGLINYENN